MRRKSWKLIIAGALIVFMNSSLVEASSRHYILSQEYHTTSKGEFEIELYNDFIFAEADNDDSYKSKHQIELEYGLTEHLQLAYYEVYTWDRPKDWERDEFKIEAKLRLAEVGQWPVDIALYTEYKNPDGSRSSRSDEIENKLIFSKEVGDFNFTGNAIFERKINESDDWEFAYTAGVNYMLSPKTQLLLEIKDTLGDSDEFGWHRKDHKFSIAPGIYHKFNHTWRISFAPVFGITRASNDLELRSIVEIEF